MKKILGSCDEDEICVNDRKELKEHVKSEIKALVLELWKKDWKVSTHMWSHEKFSITFEIWNFFSNFLRVIFTCCF